MERLLEKNPLKRITIKDLKQHPWIRGISEDDRWNEPEVELELVQVTELDVDSAYTNVMASYHYNNGDDDDDEGAV